MENQTGSEVARLRKHIQEEYEACQRALYELSAGNAKHEFINARTENIANARKSLAALIGDQEAFKIVVEALEEAKDASEKVIL